MWIVFAWFSQLYENYILIFNIKFMEENDYKKIETNNEIIEKLYIQQINWSLQSNNYQYSKIYVFVIL